MSVWVVRQSLGAEQEADILARPYILLPFNGVPDLSGVSSPHTLRDMLQTLSPDAPPESINLTLERLWTQFTSIQSGDLVVVPLPGSKRLAVGETSGRYTYAVAEDGTDEHRIAVAWQPALVPLSRLGRHPAVASGAAIAEVTDKETRIRLYDSLPHGYNRFAKWKWLLIGLMLLQSLAMLSSMLQQP